MFDGFQFYSTPFNLARKMWSKFENKNYTRILEPSAGKGDLIEPILKEQQDNYYRPAYAINKRIDCIELDVAKHSFLQNEKELSVVGVDFLKFSNGAIYSHIIMNPPFASGVHHVLKAWDIMWNGEIVALVNAETINNPYSKERQMLCSLIDKFGNVEFVEDAFLDPETQRKTSVSVAIIHLVKEADINSDVLGNILGSLNDDPNERKEDIIDLDAISESLGTHEQTIAISESKVSNLVLVFNVALETAKESIYASEKAGYYSRLLGRPMNKVDDEGCEYGLSADSIQKKIAEQYDELKDRAWTNVLRSSEITKRLSSKVQKDFESQFDKIKKLDFTVENIYGFLLGVSENQGQIQIDMVCSIFDLITKFHSDNTVFYKGWKSNDKHRTLGMKIKKKRFILPHFGISFGNNLSWDQNRTLSDLDKVFTLLDGKAESLESLNAAFKFQIGELKAGEKIDTEYFEIRYYHGIGTIHFYPKDQKIIDRLNMLVGRERRWLPPEDGPEKVSKKFWIQYEKADKIDTKVKESIDNAAKKRDGRSYYYSDPFHAIYRDNQYNDDGVESERARNIAMIDDCLDQVIFDQLKINPQELLGA